MHSKSRVYRNHITIYHPEQPTPEDIDIFKDWCEEYCKIWVFQHEKSKKGMHHFQAVVSLKKKSMTSTTIAKIANWSKWPKGHINISPSKDINKDRYDYSIKSKTRVDGPWSNRNLKDLQPVKVLNTDNLYTWQKVCYNICMSPPDDRTVYHFLNRSGGLGKTQLFKFLAVNHSLEVALLPSVGSALQIMSSVIQMGNKSCYILDLPRSAFARATPAASQCAEYEMMHAIEKIKDGVVISAMYGKVQQLIMNHPNVIIFSNTDFDPKSLTVSRWKKFDMDRMNEEEWERTNEFLYPTRGADGVLSEKSNGSKINKEIKI